MLFADINLLDENLDYCSHQWVGVENSSITYLATSPPPASIAHRFGEVYPGKGRMLIPAFFNAHAHSAMTLLRGYAENLTLQSWLTDAVFPFEEHITPKDCYWASLLACAEMARYGVVGFSDMYFNQDESALAALDAGLKMNLGEALCAQGDEHFTDMPLYQNLKHLVQEFHGAGQGRLLVDCALHAEYTSTPHTVRELAEFAHNEGLGIQVHLSETRFEHEQCKLRHKGKTPLEYFDSLGLLEGRVCAAHGVWVSDDDIDLLAQKQVYLAANPASNMKLGSGFAPIAAMLSCGVRVCLGTDGVASNNNHDMMQDMYLLALVPKGATGDPTVVRPKQAFHAATRMGALSQGRTDCGFIAVGAKADLTVLDVTNPSWTPMTQPLINLVYAGHGADVCLTMCDGRIVYRDGTWPTLDIEQAKTEVSKRTQRIAGQLLR